MLNRTACTFNDIYALKFNDRLLLTDTTETINLNEIFYIGDISNVEFQIKEQDNLIPVVSEIDGSKLILNKTDFPGYARLKIIAKPKDKKYYCQFDLEIINPGSMYEDFEYSDFSESSLPWINDQREPWYVTNEASYLGSSSLRSGNILPGQSSSVGFDLDLKEPGTLVFAYKTSTRPYFDRLIFSIDGLIISDLESPYLWSDMNDWRVLSYSIRAGERSIKWEYKKDVYDPMNEDAVWIDAVVIPDKFNKNSISAVNDKSLLYAHPNPFNPVTEITFELPDKIHSELIIFDSKGREVEKLFSGDLEKGKYNFSFNGSRYSSGLYYSVLKYGNKVLTNKLILTK